MSWIINYLYVDEDDQIIDEHGFKDDSPAEEYGVHLMRKHNKVIGVYKEVVILDPVYELRPPEQANEAVQRYGDNPVSEHPTSDWLPCPDCNGYGTLRDEDAEAEALCPVCNGTGSIPYIKRA